MLSTFILIFSVLCIPSFAADTQEKLSSEVVIYGIDVFDSGEPFEIFDLNSNKIRKKALGECGGGSHDMLAKGWGNIYDVNKKKTIVNNGCCAQCTKCNLVIITQNEPKIGKALGYFFNNDF